MTARSATTSPTQLMLSFEPALPDRFASLREYIAHRVQVHERPAKAIAGDMDRAPSTLSRKLSPGEHDAQRFTVDDLERYMQVTKDFSAIEYLASKYLQSDDQRKARALSQLEEVIGNASRLLAALKGGEA